VCPPKKRTTKTEQNEEKRNIAIGYGSRKEGEEVKIALAMQQEIYVFSHYTDCEKDVYIGENWKTTVTTRKKVKIGGVQKRPPVLETNGFDILPIPATRAVQGAWRGRNARASQP